MKKILNFKDQNENEWEVIHTTIVGFKVSEHKSYHDVIFEAGGHIPITEKTYNEIHYYWKIHTEMDSWPKDARE